MTGLCRCEVGALACCHHGVSAGPPRLGGACPQEVAFFILTGGVVPGALERLAPATVLRAYAG